MLFVGVLALLVLVGLVGLALYGLVRLLVGRGTAGVSAGIATGGVVLVVVLVALGAGGRMAVDDGEAPSSSAEPAGRERTATTAPTGGTPLQRPRVVLTTTSADQLPAVPPALGELADGEAIVVRVQGLDPSSSASVHQCPAGAVAPSQCRAGLSATATEHQVVTLLVDLLERFETTRGPVDCTVDECSVVVFGSARLELVTVFGREAPPRVDLDTDPAAVPPGGAVTASASRLPARTSVSFAVCRPDGEGGAGCGRPSVVRSDALGRAEATLEVGAGRCGRGDTCAVAVSADGSAVLAYRQLRLIGRAGTSYDGDRVRLGLAGAAALLGLALLVLRRTDWTPVEGDPFAGVSIPDDPFAEHEPTVEEG